MKEQMENQYGAQQNSTDASPTDSTTRNWTKPSKEDYLEFEEVKEE